MVEGRTNQARTMDRHKDRMEEQRLAIVSLTLAEQAGDRAAVDTMLSIFSAQEEEVLRLRWGLGRAQLRTLRQIGEAMALSGSRVSQIDLKARRKLSWCLRMIGPVGSLEVDRYAAEMRNKHVEEERSVRQQGAEKAAKAERRRQDKFDRAEARRAKARARHWHRRIDQTMVEREGIANAKALLCERIRRLERRGWLARTVLPHRSVLAQLRAEIVELEAKILEADFAIEKLRSSQRIETSPSTASSAPGQSSDTHPPDSPQRPPPL